MQTGEDRKVKGPLTVVHLMFVGSSNVYFAVCASSYS